MSLQEKSIQCSDCGATFIFSVEEQEFYQSKGFTNEPKRCPDCRRARKSNNYSSGGYSTRREMYPVICAQCGKETEVPFQPTGNKPVYCRECFNANKGSV
ncbi:MAG: zinc-ribbon domain containing protein [Dehalococcoidales bacterium]|nr:zinc-ribbon domain containing protein [Dehalococcoidales bacterium]